MTEKYEEKRKGLFVHLFAYLMVCIITFTVDMITSPGVYWFYWPVMGMGLSVVIHWFVDFGYNRFFDNMIKNSTSNKELF